MTARKKNILVIIDPQVDFHEGGSLAVPGAGQDAKRIADLISKRNFDNIIITLDTHQYFDIGHPIYWQDKDGKHPNPFTIISSKDVEEGVWRTTRKEDQQWGLEYCRKLEKTGIHEGHTIWPYHCIVGTDGHAVVPEINKAVEEWAKKKRALVTYMWKGTNPRTEMYSAFKADVEVQGAPETHLNTHVLDRIRGYDNVFFCGQALSHCVRRSYSDLCGYFQEKGNAKAPSVYLLTDMASPVVGYEDGAKKWCEDCDKGGAQSYKFAVVTPSDKVDWKSCGL